MRVPDFAVGLVTAVVQDVSTSTVLMVAHMNEAAWQQTLQTGRATFYSRSRQCLWEKGSTSGNGQLVLEVRVDCDRDAILLLVQPEGSACHTGAVSCFDEPVADPVATGPSASTEPSARVEPSPGVEPSARVEPFR